MTNDDEAQKAMAALNGKDSGGRALTVMKYDHRRSAEASAMAGVAIVVHGTAYNHQFQCGQIATG